MASIADLARTVMRIRAERAKAESGPAPRLRGHIHYEQFRMRVTANPTREYWYWLTLAGWRECNYPRDRRTYVDLPESSFKELARRSSASREETYLQLMHSHGAE